VEIIACIPLHQMLAMVDDTQIELGIAFPEHAGAVEDVAAIFLANIKVNGQSSSTRRCHIGLTSFATPPSCRQKTTGSEPSSI
jgi:hypothetical protein